MFEKFSVRKYLFVMLVSMLFCILNASGRTVELINGRWFDGEKFVERTVRIGDGEFSFKPQKTEARQVFDLAGKYVVPPYGEAHNHNLESAYELDKRIAQYLSDGVFYVKLQSSIHRRIAPLMKNYNHPQGLDVSLAHAPLTGTDGHPIGIRKVYLERGYFDGLFKTLAEVESHGYFIIDDRADLDKKWKTVLSFRPDFIKVMLLHSEEYDRRKDDKNYFGQKGLDPALLPQVVKKARASGLRVTVHVETPSDFRTAVESGADEIAHLPGISDGRRITRETAELAARNNVTVVTTASLVTKLNKRPGYEKLLESIKFNLRTLKDAGVRLAVGSDMYDDTSRGEVLFLKELGVFSNLELLKMWTENSAATIFPERKIGKLKEGYEASFLVLEGDPLEDFANLQKIGMRFKQGRIQETNK
jgi:imidazolonepropionase-like amidohydrolase